jgi:hypothetical protein
VLKGIKLNPRQPRTRFEDDTRNGSTELKARHVQSLDTLRDPHFRIISKKPLDRSALKVHQKVTNDFEDGISIPNRDFPQRYVGDGQRIELTNPGR